MAMARFLFTILFAFNLFIFPSFAFSLPFPGNIFNPFRGLAGFDGKQKEQHPVNELLVHDHRKHKKTNKKDKKHKKNKNNDIMSYNDLGKDTNNNNNTSYNNLVEGFYKNTCPNAEQIVANEVAERFKTNPDAIASILRLTFHDCFVGGCDASILLDTVGTGERVEKGSLANGELLKGVDIIDDIKAKLEQECPGVVSCADTLAFAAAESMALGGLPPLARLGGRRDALDSLEANVAQNLPLPNWSMDQMLELFKGKGFTEEDMVVLIGAHSLGNAHCAVFSDRIYNYHQTGNADPALNQVVVGELQKVCRRPGTPEARANPTVSFDETPTVLDNLFYKNLVDQKKALLATDQQLQTDPRTTQFVKQLAANPNLFVEKFAETMVRMTAVEVLTGENGEIRKTCRSPN